MTKLAFDTLTRKKPYFIFTQFHSQTDFTHPISYDKSWKSI